MTPILLANSRAYSSGNRLFNLDADAIESMRQYDKNPVHFDAQAAQKLGFPDRIAHGMLTAAYLVGDVIAQRGYRLAKLTEIDVRFPNPAVIGSSMESILSKGNTLDINALGNNTLDAQKPYSSAEISFGQRTRYKPHATKESQQERKFINNITLEMKARGVESLHYEKGHIKISQRLPLPSDIDPRLQLGMKAIEPLLYLSGIFGEEHPGPNTLYGMQKAIFPSALYPELELHTPSSLAIQTEPLHSEPTKKGDRKKVIMKTNVWDISYLGSPLFEPYLITKGQSVLFTPLH